MNKICFGCRAKLQSESPNEEGYIPKEKLETSTYCLRCFRIMHYGKNVEFNAPKEVKSIVNNINKNAKYVLFLTDLITLNEEIIKIFKSIKAPKLLVISKSDIIPKSIIFKNVINSLKSIYNIQDDIKIIREHLDNLEKKNMVEELKYLCYEIFDYKINNYKQIKEKLDTILTKNDKKREKFLEIVKYVY